MHPILFDINGFQIYTYGVMGAIGFLFVALTAIYRGQKIGIPSERTADLIFWTAVAGLIGARVVFCFQNLEQMNTWYDWVNLRAGGLVFYGAILFGAPVASLLLRRYKMPFYATWDIYAAAFPIAHASARLGCFGAGCCYGLPYDGPLAVTFTDPLSVAPHNIALHPTQLYEASFLFVLGIGLQVLYAKKRFHGQVVLVYLLVYALGRSVVEAFRGDSSRGYFVEGIFGQALSYSQGISLVLAVVAVVVFWWMAKRSVENQISGPVAP